MGVAVTCHAFANNKHFMCEHQPAAQLGVNSQDLQLKLILLQEISFHFGRVVGKNPLTASWSREINKWRVYKIIHISFFSSTSH